MGRAWVQSIGPCRALVCMRVCPYNLIWVILELMHVFDSFTKLMKVKHVLNSAVCCNCCCSFRELTNVDIVGKKDVTSAVLVCVDTLLWTLIRELCS